MSSECLTETPKSQLSQWNQSVLSCNLCPYRTKSLFVMFRHVKKHRQPKHISTCSDPVESYVCEQCSFRSFFITSFNEHFRFNCSAKRRRKNAKPAKNPYQCKKCNFRTLSMLVLLKHSLGCTNQGVKYNKSTKFYECDQCNLRTRFKNNLSRHKRAQHAAPSTIRWYKCDLCDFQAKNWDNIKSHKISRHIPTEQIKWYECNKCSYKGKKQSALTAHIMSQHTEYKDIIWYNCANCSFQTKKKFNLEVHIRGKHLSG